MAKVLVWLSGWVDSAVAAHLLMKQWHSVTAWFMKNYVSDKGNCTTYQDAEEAIKVAKFLWIEILSFDLIKEYEDKIIKYIYEWYQNWITPNPDILCNSLIKFDVFLDKALELWFDYIATWHYAQIVENKWKFKLFRWKDHNKDQSYFLSWLNQFQLSKSLFPIWNIDKSDVRKIAKEIWLPNAERKDSQWLCFIWQIPIKQFLQERLPKKEWNILDEKWNIVWKHDWAYFFTIWQRHWLNLNFKSYVINTNVKENTVTIWDKDAENLSSCELETNNRHRISDEHNLPIEVKTKIRYRQEPEDAKLVKLEWEKMNINFTNPQRAIAPWQSIVAYIWEECIWWWIIWSKK